MGLRHGSQQCECSGCGLTFKSVAGFDAHRVGPWAARRCMTEKQLTRKGYAADKEGFWRIPRPDNITTTGATA